MAGGKVNGQPRHGSPRLAFGAVVCRRRRFILWDRGAQAAPAFALAAGTDCSFPTKMTRSRCLTSSVLNHSLAQTTCLAHKSHRTRARLGGYSDRHVSGVAGMLAGGAGRHGECLILAGFRRFWTRIARLGGLPADVTPHVLRHSFASLAADLGYSEATIAALVGHAGRSTTRGIALRRGFACALLS